MAMMTMPSATSPTRNTMVLWMVFILYSWATSRFSKVSTASVSTLPWVLISPSSLSPWYEITWSVYLFDFLRVRVHFLHLLLDEVDVLAAFLDLVLLLVGVADQLLVWG